MLLVPVISGALGFYARDKLQEEKDKYTIAANDTGRIAIYYDILSKYDDGKQEEAIDSLRGWLDIDIKVLKAYLPGLNKKEQERVKKLLAVVEAERNTSNN